MASDQDSNQGISAFYDQLDSLWTRHLILLDEYTAAQATIQKGLAAGFFSLAQANFKSPRGRYGQDHYDHRAVATTRASMIGHDASLMIHIERVYSFPTSDGGKSNVEDKEDHGKKLKIATGPDLSKSRPQQLLSPSPTPEPESQSHEKSSNDAKQTDDATQESTNAGTTDAAKTPANLHDPIRWFGILVPPTLRQAQKSFSSAVQQGDGVARAINAARGMREVDAEIRKLRKMIKKAEKGVTD